MTQLIKQPSAFIQVFEFFIRCVLEEIVKILDFTLGTQKHLALLIAKPVERTDRRCLW